MINILELTRKYNAVIVTNGWKDELFERFISLFHPYFEDLVKDRRFVLLPGQYVPDYTDIYDLHGPSSLLYGLKAFIPILKNQYYINNFDFIIYIDEDCFLYDLDTFDELLEEFDSSPADILAPPDGGVVCHRMRCSEIMPNTFLTVYKTKKFKELRDELDYSNVSKYKICPEYVNTEWYKNHLIRANCIRKEVRKFQEGKECLYTHLVETKQLDSFVYKYSLVINEKDVPYVMNEPDEARFEKLTPANYNHIDTEPYYPLFYYLMSKGFVLDYIFISDLYKDENGKVIDTYGGIASELYYKRKPFAVHTWLTRLYIPYGEFLENYNRINSLNEYAKQKKFELELL